MKQDYSTIPPAHRDIASRQATVGVSSKVNPILSRIISSYKIWLFKQELFSFFPWFSTAFAFFSFDTSVSTKLSLA